MAVKIYKDTPGRLHRQRGWREEGETSFQQECNPRPSAQETCPKNGCHMDHIQGVFFTGSALKVLSLGDSKIPT